MSFNFNFLPGSAKMDTNGNRQLRGTATLLSVGETIKQSSKGTDYVVGTIQDDNGATRSIMLYAGHLAFIGVTPGQHQPVKDFNILITALPPRNGETKPALLVTSVLVGSTTETTDDELSAFEAAFGVTTAADAAA